MRAEVRHSRAVFTAVAVVAAAILTGWLAVGPAAADEPDGVYEVTTTEDLSLSDSGVDCGDDADPDDVCSLRAAVEQASEDYDEVTDVVEIRFTDDGVGSFLDQGAIETAPFKGHLRIVGFGTGILKSGIDADRIPGGDRVIDARSVNSLTIDTVNLVDGDVDGDGGAILAEGGSVELIDAIVFRNSATGHGGAISADKATVMIRGDSSVNNNTAGDDGGAIHLTAGGVEIIDSQVASNSAGGGGGAVAAAGSVTVAGSSLEGNSAAATGGAIRAGAQGVAIEESTLNGNTAGGAGGAIHSSTGDVDITASTLADNEAGVSGGAVVNTTGDTSITDSSLEGNTSEESGGAVNITGPVGASAGELSITRSTLADNEATSFSGGAIRAADGPVTLETSTVTGNAAGSAGGGLDLGTGDDEVAIVATTIADNTAAGDGAQLATQRSVVVERTVLAGGDPVCHVAGQGSIDSQDHNLASDATCELDQASDQVAVEPLLGELGDHGGDTEVRLPAEDSPLIDAGGDGCDGETDQRGIERPQGEACDIGAVEVVAEAVTGVERHAGADRVATAIALAEQAFPDGADTVVLATGNAPPDSLGAAPLAAAVDGPLLLTRGASLEASVSQALADLGTDEVIVIGGTAAVPQAVETDLLAQGLDVERVFGADRYATAAAVADEIADRVGPRDHALVAASDPGDDGVGWPDALAAGSYAGVDASPILLTATDTLPEPTSTALVGLDAVEIVGGTAVVSAGVEASIGGHVDTVERLSGANRWETAVAVADATVDAGVDPDPVWVATGWNWPDGLAAGAAAAAEEGVLALVDGDDLDG